MWLPGGAVAAIRGRECGQAARGRGPRRDYGTALRYWSIVRPRAQRISILITHASLDSVNTLSAVKYHHLAVVSVTLVLHHHVACVAADVLSSVRSWWNHSVHSNDY